ncbi:FeoB-associated Cys-rich membrane protein [Lawsonibacter sp. JLR.KK007]
MPPGEFVVILVLACVVGLAVRSLWKSRRAGGSCNGDCSQCSGCHHK